MKTIKFHIIIILSLLIGACEADINNVPISTEPETIKIIQDTITMSETALVLQKNYILAGKIFINTIIANLERSQVVHRQDGSIFVVQKSELASQAKQWSWLLFEPGEYFISFYQNGNKPADTTLTVPANASINNPYSVVQIPENYTTPLRVVIQWNNQTKNDLFEFTIQ